MADLNPELSALLAAATPRPWTDAHQLSAPDLVLALHAVNTLEAREAALEVVRQHYDKGRLIERAEAMELCDKGKGYMMIPHEECIEAIRAALAAMEGGGGIE